MSDGFLVVSVVCPCVFYCGAGAQDFFYLGGRSSRGATGRKGMRNFSCVPRHSYSAAPSEVQGERRNLSAFIWPPFYIVNMNC